MKTAISVPDDLFDSVTHWTATLGIPRSTFFARAARHYIAELEAESYTQQINDALERIGGDGTLPDVLDYNVRRLAEDAEDW